MHVEFDNGQDWGRMPCMPPCSLHYVHDALMICKCSCMFDVSLHLTWTLSRATTHKRHRIWPSNNTHIWPDVTSFLSTASACSSTVCCNSSLAWSTTMILLSVQAHTVDLQQTRSDPMHHKHYVSTTAHQYNATDTFASTVSIALLIMCQNESGPGWLNSLLCCHGKFRLLQSKVFGGNVYLQL